MSSHCIDRNIRFNRPSAIIAALRRVDLPQNLLGINQFIYSDKKFAIRDCGQASGILQGQPLSPFLFLKLMTVLVHGTINKLTAKDDELVQNENMAKLLYADSTLLLNVAVDIIEASPCAVSQTATEYGA